MLKKAADLLEDDIIRGVRCQRSGREADLWPEVRRIDLSMHASNGPQCASRGHFYDSFSILLRVG